jgi:hypothetical protein
MTRDSSSGRYFAQSLNDVRRTLGADHIPTAAIIVSAGSGMSSCTGARHLRQHVLGVGVIR